MVKLIPDFLQQLITKVKEVTYAAFCCVTEYNCGTLFGSVYTEYFVTFSYNQAISFVLSTLYREDIEIEK